MLKATDNGKCKFHATLENFVAAQKESTPAPDPTECAVCLLEIDPKDQLLLQCNHIFHLECIKPLVKAECPLCRANLTDLPNDIKEQIESNRRKNLVETEEANRQELIDSIFGNAGIPTTSPQLEVIMAFQYLNDLGIPSSELPGSTTIDLDPDSPLPATGEIFTHTVRQVLDSIQTRVDDVSDSIAADESDDDVSDDAAADESDDDVDAGADTEIMNTNSFVFFLPLLRR